MSIVFGFAGVPVKVILPLTVPAIMRHGHSSRAEARKNFVDGIVAYSFRI
jgi:hypothetical protein